MIWTSSSSFSIQFSWLSAITISQISKMLSFHLTGADRTVVQT
jgi:hypothetical protein